MRWSLSKSGAMALNKWQHWGSLWSPIGLYRILMDFGFQIKPWSPSIQMPQLRSHTWFTTSLTAGPWEIWETDGAGALQTSPANHNPEVPAQGDPKAELCELVFTAVPGRGPRNHGIFPPVRGHWKWTLPGHELLDASPSHSSFLLWRSVLVIWRFTQDFGAFKWPSTIRHHWYHGTFNQIDRFPPKKKLSSKSAMGFSYFTSK